MRRARARVSSCKDVAGTTLFISPQSAAVAAGIMSPVSSISSARLRPMGAADDLDILRRAAFVYDEAHDDGGIHARAAGLFAVLRFGSGDDARRAGGPGLGK